MCLASGSSTVVEHSPHQTKVEGLNPGAVDTGRGQMGNKRSLCTQAVTVAQ